MSLNIILVSNSVCQQVNFIALSLSSEINKLNLNFCSIFRICAFSKINVVKIKMLLVMLYCYFFLYKTYCIIISKLFYFFIVNAAAIAIVIAIIVEVGMNKREDSPSLSPVCNFLSLDFCDCFQKISIPFA